MAAKHRVTVVIHNGAIRGFHGTAAHADGATLTLPAEVINPRIEAHEIAHAAARNTDSPQYECASETFRTVEREATRRTCGLKALVEVLSYHCHEMGEIVDEHEDHNRPSAAARAQTALDECKSRLHFAQKRLARR
jgi:hypothetical protein